MNQSDRLPIAFAAFINVLCSGGLYYLNSKLRKKKSELREYNEASVFSPSTLLTYLQNQESKAKLERSSDNPKEYIIKCFVEGIVDCKNPVKSRVDGNTDLVYSLKTYKELFSNDSIAELCNIPIYQYEPNTLSAPLQFSLKDAKTEKHFCVVKRNSDVQTVNVLSRIADRTEMKELNLVEKAIVQVGNVIELVMIFLRNVSLFKGIKIGWSESEFGIRVGSILTVYGELIYDSENKTLRIDTPLSFLSEKAALLKETKQGISSIYWKMSLIAIPFFFSGLYLVKKGMKIYKELKARQENEVMDEAIQTGKAFVDQDEDYKCIVCIERPRNLIFKPCMHFSMCSVCYKKLNKDACPLCKKTITDTLNVIFES